MKGAGTSATYRRDHLAGSGTGGGSCAPPYSTQRLRLDDVDTALAAMGSGDIVRQVIIHG